MKNKLYAIGLILLAISMISGVVDLNQLFNYESQEIPPYISRSNIPSDNIITDRGSTLGRVLFYDKKMSVNNTISCASCHLQEFAFSDTALVSKGVNGFTGRHSMRLINAGFSDEVRFFWDERALSLEDQSTKPIQDHVEMGFSGEMGDPGFDSLISKLQAVEYYPYLFNFAFGDSSITELKIQSALAQFVRSIQSFDSKYDDGRSLANNDFEEFPNFTKQENLGKELFFGPPGSNGAGCFRCHTEPEFSIIQSTMNNGVIGVANKPGEFDIIVTRAPTLRNLVHPSGRTNGPFMHDGSLKTLMDVINHYNDLEPNPNNFNLDFRLQGDMHDLKLNQIQKEALVAFLKTLSGVKVYTEEKYSDPFDSTGNIEVIPLITDAITNSPKATKIKIFPNPALDFIQLNLPLGQYHVSFYDLEGKGIMNSNINSGDKIDINDLSNGIFIVQIRNIKTSKLFVAKLLVE